MESNISVEYNLCQTLINRCFERSKIAFFYKDEKITYSDFLERSGALANGLSKWLNKGDRLIICLNDTPAIPYLFLASLSLGVIPVIVNPRLKENSLEYILRDSGAKAIACEYENTSLVSAILGKQSMAVTAIVQDCYCQSANDVDAKFDSVVNLSDLMSMAATLEPIAVEENHSAFWQYTSGTTGNPKAVQHAGDTMVQNHNAYVRLGFGRGSEDIYYSCAKMFFGYGFGATVLFPILSNASSVIDPSFPVSDLVAAKSIQKYKPTLFFGAPVIYQSMVDNQEYMKSIVCPRIICISAGSKLPEKLFNTWKAVFGSNIYDGIGATEMGHIFISNTPERYKAGTTGMPLNGYEVRLENKGESGVGILCVKGSHKNLGYWNNVQKTQEKFVDGWYRTGDLFSIDEDGYYIYHGREDEVFKSNGIWLSPAGIEQAIISSFVDIQDCAIVPEEDKNQHTKPAYYIVTRLDGDGRNKLKSQLIEWITSHYESAFAPGLGSIYFVNALTRNDNGKLVRHRLNELLSKVNH